MEPRLIHSLSTIHNMSMEDVAKELSGEGDRIPPLLRTPEKFVPPQYDPLLQGTIKATRGL